jgi:hypothetical protein
MIDLEDKDFGLPDEIVMACEDGLVENHEYVDMRGVPREMWDQILDFEQRAMAWKAQGKSLDDAEMDGEMDGEILEALDSFQWGLDVGIGSTVAALSIAGACPVTSCSGDHDGAFEQHPLVMAWVPESLRPALAAAAYEAGIHATGGYNPGVLVWVDEPGLIARMRDFAIALVRLTAPGGTDAEK